MASNGSSGRYSSNASDETSTTSESSLGGGRGPASFAAHGSNNIVGHSGTIKEDKTVAKTPVGTSAVGEGKQFGRDGQHCTKYSSPRLAFDKAVAAPGQSSRANADMNATNSLSGCAVSSPQNLLDDNMDHSFDDSLNGCWETTVDEYFNDQANFSSVWNTPPIHKDDVLPDLYNLAVRIAAATNVETGSGPVSSVGHVLTPTTASGSTGHQQLSPSCCPRAGYTNASTTSVSVTPNGFSGTVSQVDDQSKNVRIYLPESAVASRPTDRNICPAIGGNGFVGSPLPPRSLVSSIASRNDGSGSPAVSSSPHCHSSFQSPPVAAVWNSEPRNIVANAPFVNRTARPWSCDKVSGVDHLAPKAKHFRRNLNSQWALWPTNTNGLSRCPESDGTDCFRSNSAVQNKGQSTNLATEMNCDVFKSTTMFPYTRNGNNTFNSGNSTAYEFTDNSAVACPVSTSSDGKIAFSSNPRSASMSSLSLNKLDIWNPKINECAQASPSHSDGYTEQGQGGISRSPACSRWESNQGLNVPGPLPPTFSPASHSMRSSPSSQMTISHPPETATASVDAQQQQQQQQQPDMTLFNILMNLSGQAPPVALCSDDTMHRNTSNVTAQAAMPPPHAAYCTSLSAEHHGSAPKSGISASPGTPGNQCFSNGREFQEPLNRFGDYPPINGYNEGPMYSGPTHEHGSGPPPVFGFFGAAVHEPLNGVAGSPWFSPQSKDHCGQGMSPPSQLMHRQESDLVSLMRELAIEKQQKQQVSDAYMTRWDSAEQFSAGGGYGGHVPGYGGPAVNFMGGGGHFAAAVAATAGPGCNQGGSVMAMTASMEGALSCSPPGGTGTPFSTPTKGCVFCKNNSYHSTFYKSHVLKDERGHCTCPVLRTYVCPLCRGTGDAAHTLKYCPLNTVTKGDPIAAGLPPGKVTNWRDVANKMPHINCPF